MSAVKQQPITKERPILFSAPMVKAILGGIKTQTRRVISIQPPTPEYRFTTLLDTTSKEDRKRIGMHRWAIVEGLDIVKDDRNFFRCPYGQVGHHLWVRETFRHYGNSFVGGKSFALIEYVADGKNAKIEVFHDLPVRPDWTKKQPSIFMPRWASRISLKIKDISVERLNDISYPDCRAEGINLRASMFKEYSADERHLWDERRAFELGWDSINGKRKGCDWQSNPFVWVVEFQKVSQ